MGHRNHLSITIDPSLQKRTRTGDMTRKTRTDDLGSWLSFMDWQCNQAKSLVWNMCFNINWCFQKKTIDWLIFIHINKVGVYPEWVDIHPLLPLPPLPLLTLSGAIAPSAKGITMSHVQWVEPSDSLKRASKWAGPRAWEAPDCFLFLFFFTFLFSFFAFFFTFVYTLNYSKYIY